MAAPAVFPLLARPIPTPRSAGDSYLPSLPPPTTAPSIRPRTGDVAPDGPLGRAVAYQRVVHQLIRRELRLLAELASWAPADDTGRTAALTQHAHLVGRVLLHHHAVERELLWPSLLRDVPGDRRDETHAAVSDWGDRCVRIDQRMRDIAMCAARWRVAGTPSAREAFTRACRDLADAVHHHTFEEERALLPLLDDYLDPADWTMITRAADCRLSTRERLLVLGLALEDACAVDRGRLLDGLPPPTRLAWRLSGRRHHLAAVVRLRGAPPAR